MVTVALLAAVVVLSVSARSAKNNLEYVSVNTQQFETAITEGDQMQAVKTLKALQKSAATADKSTSGWLWRLASKTPILGKNLSAVHTSTAVLNDIATDGLDPLVSASGVPSLQSFSPTDGRLDLSALLNLATAVSHTRAVTEAGDQRMKAIDTDSLLGSVAGPVRQIKEKVASAAQTVRSAQTALQLLPPMLGSEEPRTYLAIFQNNAEIRSTGGLPGAFALLKVDNGKIKLGKQGTGASFGHLPKPIMPLTDDESQIYTKKMARYFQDTNFTPDFQRTAQLTTAILKQETGTNVDGVISVDPVTLGYILAGTGPVTLGGGRFVHSENAVDVLLNQVYFEITDPTEQDEFFAASASRIFDAVAQGKGNPEVVMSGILRGALEHRVYVWSKHNDEEKILQDVRIGGALTPRVADSPNVGIFLNDGTGAKMQYYLDFDSTVKSAKCLSDGGQELVATVKLRSNAPADSRGLPASVVGPGYGTKPGSMIMNLRFYAPLGGSFASASIDGEELPTSQQSHDGRPVATVAVRLGPLEQRTVRVRMFSGPEKAKKATVAVTPGILKGKHLLVGRSACGGT